MYGVVRDIFKEKLTRIAMLTAPCDDLWTTRAPHCNLVSIARDIYRVQNNKKKECRIAEYLSIQYKCRRLRDA